MRIAFEMGARTAALRPSLPQVYQEMISLPMEKPGGGEGKQSLDFDSLKSYIPRNRDAQGGSKG